MDSRQIVEALIRHANVDTEARETLRHLLSGGDNGTIPPPEKGGGGMDPWQSSVETRLGSLDSRLGRVEEKLGGLATDTAVMKADIKHLPTKGYINIALLGLLTAIAALTAFADRIQAFIG